jgi:hypothetical protein
MEVMMNSSSFLKHSFTALMVGLHHPEAGPYIADHRKWTPELKAKLASNLEVLVDHLRDPQPVADERGRETK